RRRRRRTVPGRSSGRSAAHRRAAAPSMRGYRRPRRGGPPPVAGRRATPGRPRVNRQGWRRRRPAWRGSAASRKTLVTKPVAAAPDRLDRVSPKGSVDLFAEIADIHVDDVRDAVVAEIPDVLDDPRPAQDLARPTHEELEQRELLCGELDRDPATCHPPRGRIKSEVPGPQNRRPLSGAAADEGSQTGQELAERERLRQVVVGTRIESCHTIGDRCAGRQHEDGRPVAAGAYLPAYLE